MPPVAAPPSTPAPPPPATGPAACLELYRAWIGLLPTGLGCAVAPVSDHSDRLVGAEAALAEGVHPRRLASFSSGRLAARAALADAGYEGGPAAIGSLGGAPVPPEGWRLSITHTNTFAVAAACTSRRALSLGIDLEQFQRLNPAWRPHVVRPVDNVFEQATPVELALVFSLKESLFKALSSAGEERLFDEVGVDWESRSGSPRLRPSAELQTLRLDWGARRVDEHVLTFCLVSG